MAKTHTEIVKTSKPQNNSNKNELEPGQHFNKNVEYIFQRMFITQ